MREAIPIDPTSITESDEARFCAKWKRGAGRCWVWDGCRRGDGYGRFGFSGRIVYAHRFSWVVSNQRSIPDGLTLDHLCRNPSCVNPEHLTPATLGENVLRGHGPSAVNKRKTHCCRGHELSGANLKATSTGWRRCRTCHNESMRRLRARRRLIQSQT